MKPFLALAGLALSAGLLTACTDDGYVMAAARSTRATALTTGSRTAAGMLAITARTTTATGAATTATTTASATTAATAATIMAISAAIAIPTARTGAGSRAAARLGWSRPQAQDELGRSLPVTGR